MKFLKLFALSGCAVFFLSSCDFSVGKKKQLKYNHTTLTDTDGYRFFQTVGGIAAYEVDYADYAGNNATSANAKDLASKSKEVYSELLPLLDSLATKFQVDFPIRGAEVFDQAQFEDVNVQEAETEADSTDTETIVEEVTSLFEDKSYAAHVKASAEEVLEQFDRLSRNTNNELRDFSNTELRNKIENLYQTAGGGEE